MARICAVIFKYTFGVCATDLTAPNITSSSLSTTNANTALVRCGQRINLTFASDEPLDVNSVTVQLNGVNATSVENTNGNEWSAAMLVEASEFENGAVNISVTYSDLAGNVGDELTESGISESVTIGICCVSSVA